MSTRAKFRVDAIEDAGWAGQDAKSIALSAVTSGSEENEGFFAATPGGNITLNVVNPKAAEQFEIGKEYYVDFTLAE